MKANSYSDAILILGNGFDLNLGLKTSYTDFVGSEEFKRLLNDNELAKHLHRKHTLQRWVDIEAEFVVYSQREIGERMSTEEVKEDYLAIKKALIDYLKTIDTNTCDKNSFIWYFIIQLLNNIDLARGESIDVVCFNYTNTIELFPNQIENVFLSNKIQRYFNGIKYCHGKLFERNIVFGVEDSAEIKKEHVFFIKTTQLGDATGSNKSLNLSDILSNKSNIFFIGHSLGQADYTYFQDFFKDCVDGKHQNKNIFITYHNDEAKDSLNSELNILTDHSLSKLHNTNNLHFIDVRNASFKFNNHNYTFPPK